MVSFSHRTLLGGDREPAHLDGFGQIPADLARQLGHNTVDAGLKLRLRRLYAGPDRRRVAMDSLSRLFLKALPDRSSSATSSAAHPGAMHRSATLTARMTTTPAARPRPVAARASAKAATTRRQPPTGEPAGSRRGDPRHQSHLRTAQSHLRDRRAALTSAVRRCVVAADVPHMPRSAHQGCDGNRVRDMASDDVASALAEALRLLVQFVDERPDDATQDDDVQALEDAAYVLHQVTGNSRIELTSLLGPDVSEALGLD